jgi:hypothetical protein
VNLGLGEWIGYAEPADFAIGIPERDRRPIRPGGLRDARDVVKPELATSRADHGLPTECPGVVLQR